MVYPAIKHLISTENTELISMELHDTRIAKLFDMNSGIDVFQIVPNIGIRGIASRVQYGKDWGTLTIRYETVSGAKTEYGKRMKAIQSDGKWLYPDLTIQSYVTSRKDPELLSAAIVKTKELYTAIYEKRLPYWFQAYDNKFMCLGWAAIQKAGIEISIVRRPPGQLELFG